jgi:hypothetical protein|tara:strand:+ start:15467 stop:15994 length:528 start_codon:yes stop_codon:yes gene_type:complete
MTNYIYLAGPIAGMDGDDANDWRDYVCQQFDQSQYNGQIVGVSPLRCEPPNEDGVYDSFLDRIDEQPWYRTPRAIDTKNQLDTWRSSAILAYMPESLIKERLSVGTIMEIAWGIAVRKPVFLVSDYPALVNHPLIDRNVASVCYDVDEAIEQIFSVYGVYTIQPVAFISHVGEKE